MQSHSENSVLPSFCLCYNKFVEFKGAIHGEHLVLSTRVEGFDSPWLHAKKHQFNWCFLVLVTPRIVSWNLLYAQNCGFGGS